MRLINYINEGSIKEKKELEKNCSQMIKLYQKYEKFLYRAVKGSKDFIKKKSRVEKRNPRDMPEGIHNKLNLIFKKKFGWPVRNGIFVSGSASSIEEYGHTYAFFPKNGFKYCWSPKIRDLYVWIDQEIGRDAFEKGILRRIEKWEEVEEKVLNKIILNALNQYTDKKIELAISNDVDREIIFNVKEYYLVDALAAEKWLFGDDWRLI